MVYQYTKPRAPISAMYNTPGPSYGLPTLTGQQQHDPRSTYRKQPAYTFGQRYKIRLGVDDSPGPQPLELTAPFDGKVYRDGKDGTPRYSLGSRRKDGSHFLTPSPVEYTDAGRGAILFTKARHPAFSFGSRSKYRTVDNTPSSNMYTLPSTLGHTVDSRKKEAPCYSLGGRQLSGGFVNKNMIQNPGPFAHNLVDMDKYKVRAPSFSMAHRFQRYSVISRESGKSYRPYSSSRHMQKCPAFNKTTTKTTQGPMYSFGIHHSQYRMPVVIGESE